MSTATTPVPGFSGGSVVKRLPDNAGAWVHSLAWEGPLEKETATHSSVLACEIPWTQGYSPRAHKELGTTQQLNGNSWPAGSPVGPPPKGRPGPLALTTDQAPLTHSPRGNAVSVLARARTDLCVPASLVLGTAWHSVTFTHDADESCVDKEKGHPSRRPQRPLPLGGCPQHPWAASSKGVRPQGYFCLPDNPCSTQHPPAPHERKSGSFLLPPHDFTPLGSFEFGREQD